MSVTSAQNRSPVQQPQKPALPGPKVDPSIERYVQAELASVGHFRKIAALVLLHGAARGTMTPEEKAGIRLVLSKYADQIDADAKPLLRGALKVSAKKTEKDLKYDSRLVQEYFGYISGDGRVTKGDIDYVLVTAKNIGGSENVKRYLRSTLVVHGDKFDADARATVLGFTG